MDFMVMTAPETVAEIGEPVEFIAEARLWAS
jgi:hypothetical protein